MPRSRSQRLRMICDEHMSPVFVRVGCAESGNAAAERRVCETEYELKCICAFFFQESFCPSFPSLSFFFLRGSTRRAFEPNVPTNNTSSLKTIILLHLEANTDALFVLLPKLIHHLLGNRFRFRFVRFRETFTPHTARRTIKFTAFHIHRGRTQ